MHRQDAAAIVGILTAVSKVQRFDIVVMFADDEDKKGRNFVGLCSSAFSQLAHLDQLVWTAIKAIFATLRASASKEVAAQVASLAAVYDAA